MAWPAELQQTDTAAANGFNVACSGESAGVTTPAHDARAGGFAGTVEVNMEASTDGVNDACFVFQSPSPAETTWPAGDWTVRMNHTTDRTNTTFSGIAVCERTTAPAYNTVAIGKDLTPAAPAAIYTNTVTAASDHSAASSSTIYIVCMYSQSGHGNKTVGVTPDQIIDVPQAGGGPTGRLMLLGVG